MTKRFTSEEEDEIRRLRSQGATFAELRKQFNCGSSCLSRILDKYVRIKDRFSDEDKQKIKELHDKGIFYTQLGLMYKVDGQIIKQIVKELEDSDDSEKIVKKTIAV